MNKLFKLWKGRYKFYALALLGAALVVCFAMLSPSVGTQPEKARSAQEFVDSIGVNTHLFYDDTVYFQKYNEIIKPKLLELGVRHIRDGAVINYNGYYDRLKELGTLGIRATLIADPRVSTPQKALEIVKMFGSMVEAVEGPNEYDGYTHADSNWVNTLRSYQKSLYATVKDDRATASLPVIGPSFINTSNFSTLSDLRAYVDYGNMHSYPGGKRPSEPIDSSIDLAQQLSGKAKPAIATETGYHNALNKNESWSQAGTSETASGKYIPRLYLEYFNRRVPRTYNYEFIDLRADPKKDNSENNYGLLRNDGSPKPAFIALKNLIALLKDPGNSFPLKSLDYSLSGDTTDVHHTLLQKRDGRFYLILWQEVPSFNLQEKSDIEVTDRLVTLTLNTSIRQAVVYQPLNSSTAIRQYTKPKQLKLSVPDHPLAIELISSTRRANG